jgi:eukaryotic-like serine/threonine-protein kinase
MTFGEIEIAPGYHALDLLRRGSLLDVYDCWSLERRCRCVVKMVRPDRAGDARAQRRLLREGSLLRRLAHPHIVRVFDVLRAPRPVVVLETVTGATLAHLLTRYPRGLGAADVAVLGLQLASAIQYLHSQHVLHLDLKPSNIIVAGDQVKVLDLDIARPPGRGRGEGTRQYMAPEQARRDMLTSATDVWALGVVLFEATTGKLPFSFVNEYDHPQLTQRARAIRRYRRGIPQALTTAIEAALRPEPVDRPSIDQLAQTLATLIDDSSAWLAA